jgi:hypothetical protein
VFNAVLSIHVENAPSTKNQQIHGKKVLLIATATYFTLALNLQSAVDPNQREGKPG